MSQYPPGGPAGPAPTGPMSYQTPPGAGASQGLAVASLICGILSILSLCFWFVSIPLGIIAVILAVVARGKIARGEAGGAGLAKGGMICGIIGAALSLLLTIAAWAGLSMLGSWAEKQRVDFERQQQQQSVPDTQPAAE